MICNSSSTIAGGDGLGGLLITEKGSEKVFPNPSARLPNFEEASQSGTAPLHHQWRPDTVPLQTLPNPDTDDVKGNSLMERNELSAWQSRDRVLITIINNNYYCQFKIFSFFSPFCFSVDHSSTEQE